jgi:hypothetical protein
MREVAAAVAFYATNPTRDTCILATTLARATDYLSKYSRLYTSYNVAVSHHTRHTAACAARIPHPKDDLGLSRVYSR